MARIILADDGVSFDGASAASGAIGGAEGAVVALVEALAARGHEVIAATRCVAPSTWRGVTWMPVGHLAQLSSSPVDLYIANRSNHLIGHLPAARRRVFWLHNPAGYLLKLRYLWPLWRWRPHLVFAGPTHAASCPGWVPDGGRSMIPLGVSPEFLAAPMRSEAPPPVAVFASNPLRGLDWVLDRWQEIHQAVPEARLRVYSGLSVYRGGADRHRAAAEAVLARAATSAGVDLCAPVGRAELARVYASEVRVMLYQGDAGETFCLALAEAQAAGLPAVIGELGAVPERIVSGTTGFVAAEPASFVHHAVRLLGDSPLWIAQHRAAVTQQRSLTWDRAAERFEALLPS
ncbi:MAG: glycosyltransferase family 1 protein [Alphaproteobacteria bacterium]|nr:MAG: glycosyltransferase family 1 protein [Alphaproteobacteria bacterium]